MTDTRSAVELIYPARFRCAGRIGLLEVSGWLVVEVGKLTYQTNSIGRNALRGAGYHEGPLHTSGIVHRDNRVTVVTPRLALPWWRAWALLFDDSFAGSFAPTGISPQHLRGVLESAGFEVRQIRTWFALSPRHSGLPLPADQIFPRGRSRSQFVAYRAVVFGAAAGAIAGGMSGFVAVGVAVGLVAAIGTLMPILHPRD